MQSVRIEWEGTFSVDDVIASLNNKDDYGLYQIYGKHIIFGENSLLYIGMTDKPFSERLKTHRSDSLWYDEEQGKVFIRIARVPRAVLKDAEALEIYWHSPPYNSANIYDYAGNPLQIVNEGNRGSLVKSLSTERLPWYKPNEWRPR